MISALRKLKQGNARLTTLHIAGQPVSQKLGMLNCAIILMASEVRLEGSEAKLYPVQL